MSLDLIDFQQSVSEKLNDFRKNLPFTVELQGDIFARPHYLSTLLLFPASVDDIPPESVSEIGAYVEITYLLHKLRISSPFDERGMIHQRLPEKYNIGELANAGFQLQMMRDLRFTNVSNISDERRVQYLKDFSHFSLELTRIRNVILSDEIVSKENALKRNQSTLLVSLELLAPIFQLEVDTFRDNMSILSLLIKLYQTSILYQCFDRNSASDIIEKINVADIYVLGIEYALGLPSQSKLTARLVSLIDAMGTNVDATVDIIVDIKTTLISDYHNILKQIHSILDVKESRYQENVQWYISSYIQEVD